MRERVIRDEIHKDILVPSQHAKIIDTKEFQRLRSIQQLSTCEYVFPAANHNRFSHSLGAYHLATKLTELIQEVQPGMIQSDDAELVQLAALLHDIGHPPYSHLLETPKVFAKYHSHEHWGRLLLESEETEIGAVVREILGEDRLGRLFAILDGESEFNGEPIPPFMKEIVSSQLDVDRMDYLVRDQANTGAQIGGFDIDRVFRALRVGKDGHFHVKKWGLPAVEAYLVTRYHMYNQVYFHKVNMLTQNYLVGMLSRAKELASQGALVLDAKLSNMLLNESLSPSQYAELTDSHVKVVLDDWSYHDDELLSLYAGKLLSRREFHKSLRIDTLDVNMVEIVRERLEAFVEECGFDASIHVLYARISKRGYMPYQQGIILEDGRDASEHSAMIRSLALPNERAMVFVPEAVRDEAEALVREWIKPSQSSLSQFS
ncbi:MAG: HD domain-containing protein [Candidatus Thermoplasmatota archaeon]|nr:HD domain-containing protein [Candidatus Thermoplasmatota archaeon]